tara:strand:- start:127638 stop:129044 length:1407 start_codon:yes stop_codon:yes gene_type:complete
MTETESETAVGSEVSTDDSERPWDTLVELAREGDSAELLDFLRRLSTGDQILALSRLDLDDRASVLAVLPAEDSADLLGMLPEVQAVRSIANMEAGAAAEIVREMSSDVQADMLGEMRPEEATAILSEMPSSEAEAVRELVAYDDDVAGGLMASEMLVFTDEMTVGEVTQHLIENSEQYDDYDVQYGYVCDAQGRLFGVLPMRNLLFAKRSAILRDVMISNPISVPDRLPLDELRDFFDSHNFLGVPVVDDDGKLRGVVHRDSVAEEETRAVASDYLKSQGIVGGEEVRSMPLWHRASRRLSWLSVNIVLNIVAASVIAFYQDTLASVIALAVFLPIISDMSGCSGNQAVAVSMRELSLGLVRPTEIMRVWMKELSAGLLNGGILGLLVAFVAYLWKGNPYLGVVVGVSLFANTVIAVSIGGTVPLILKRFGFDPAVASGPLLTTVTDMCGFFLVLGLATMMLPLLVG